MELHRPVLLYVFFVISIKAQNWQSSQGMLKPTTGVRTSAAPVYRHKANRINPLPMLIKTNGKRPVRQGDLPDFEETKSLEDFDQTESVVTSTDVTKLNQIDELPAFEETTSADGFDEEVETEVETSPGSNDSKKNDVDDTTLPDSSLIVIPEEDPPASETPTPTISTTDSLQIPNNEGDSRVEDEDSEEAAELLKLLEETSAQFDAIFKATEATSNALGETTIAEDFLRKNIMALENQIIDLEQKTATLENQVAKLPRLETVRVTVQQIFQQALAQTRHSINRPTHWRPYSLQQNSPAYHSSNVVPVVFRYGRVLKLDEMEDGIREINKSLSDAVFRPHCISIQESDNLLVCAKSYLKENTTEVGGSDVGTMVKDLCKRL